jgi:hypothetical protein
MEHSHSRVGTYAGKLVRDSHEAPLSSVTATVGDDPPARMRSPTRGPPGPTSNRRLRISPEIHVLAAVSAFFSLG